MMDRNAYMRRWRSAQPPEWHEANRAYLREWHARNRLAQNARRSERYRQNKHHHQMVVKANKLKREAVDPEGERLKRGHRRKTAKARRRMCIPSESKLTLREWKALIEAWGGLCAYCKAPTANPTQDHITPVSKGGLHTMENVVPACMRCNQRKSNRDIGDFLVELLDCNHYSSAAN